jgi:uncharacterized lipoprotein YajG
MNAKVFKCSAILTALSLLAGCATTVQTKDNSPILSAEQAQAMIHVEVRVLEPLPVEEAVASLR